MIQNECLSDISTFENFNTLKRKRPLENATEAEKSSRFLNASRPHLKSPNLKKPSQKTIVNDPLLIRKNVARLRTHSLKERKLV